jgi:hypothetical protein
LEKTRSPKRFNPDTQEAFTEYILKEFKRRREGVWFMNNGEAVYLLLSITWVCNGTKWQIQEVIKNLHGTSEYVLFRQSLPY